jgi:hypothetical protein
VTESNNERGWQRHAARLVGIGLLAGGAVDAAGLNDTGQITCTNDTRVVAPEPGTHPRQDCTIGRDAAAAAGLLPKTGVGGKGFDYSKIANNGTLLPATATLGSGAGQWACTRDNVSDLTWEVKTFGYNDLRYYWRSYSWYDDIHADNNGGYPGVTGTDTCGATLPGGLCNTQAYVAAVNAAGLCGRRDWRLPTDLELQGLVDYGIASPGPTLDAAYFPNTRSTMYWSSTPTSYGVYPYFALVVSYEDGYLSYARKDLAYPVRLVRGGQ